MQSSLNKQPPGGLAKGSAGSFAGVAQWPLRCAALLLATLATLLPGAFANARSTVETVQSPMHALASTAPLSAANPAPVTSTIISRNIVIADNETLADITRRELGRAGYAPLVAEFNGLAVESPLPSGGIIRLPIQVPSRGEFAEVVFVKGSATLRRVTLSTMPIVSASLGGSVTGSVSGADELPVQRGTEVFPGDMLFVGSDGFVSLVFSSGAVVNLQPDTIAGLERLSCLPQDDSCLIALTTQDGTMTLDVRQRDNQPVEFKVDTPQATAAVRGTEFDMAVSDDLTLGVTEGLVDVEAQGERVAVANGFGVQVEAGQAPGQPIPLLPPPVFNSVPFRMAPGDTIRWWAIPDASSYQALLTRDEAASDTVESREVNTNSVSFSSVSSGDYFLNVRAIDTNELKGIPSSTRLTIAEIDTSIEPVTTTITREGREFLVSVEQGPEIARGYEIELSPDESFEDPLRVDVDEKGQAVFVLDSDRVFARARVLLDPYTVSAFGPSSSSDSR